jgi:hypothetical protein
MGVWSRERPLTFAGDSFRWWSAGKVHAEPSATAFTGVTPEHAPACGFGIRFLEPAFLQPLVVPVTGGGIAQGHATDHLQESLVTYQVTHAVRLTCQDCAKGG